MEQLKIIEQNIKEILDSGKPLVDLTEKFDNILNDLNLGYSNLGSNKIQLLNILLKYPKKKILFDFIADLDNRGKGYERKFIIGLNENGLGLIQGNYEHNLRNINYYWSKENFAKLIKDENFRKLFFEKIGKKHKEIMQKLVRDDTKEYNKEFMVGKIKVVIGNIRIEYKIENKDNDEDNINLLTNKPNCNFNFEELTEFVDLLKNKDKIIEKLSEEIKDYEKLQAELKEKTIEIDNELKPYLALKQI